MADFKPLCSVDGRFSDHVPASDRGLAYGDGVFETLRIAGGRIPFWPLHLDRLQEGGKRLGIQLDEPALQAQLAELLDRLPAPSALLKIILTRGCGGRGYQPPPEPQPRLILRASPLPALEARTGEEGIAAWLCEHRLPDNSALAGIKHLNRLDYVQAAREWQQSHCREGLLRSQDGDLLEAGSRNLFWVRQGRLLTPSLARAGVAGVMRRKIVEDYGPKLKLAVAEARLQPADLTLVDELFLCNSVHGIWPVRSVLSADGAEIRLRCGELGRQLQTFFNQEFAGSQQSAS